MPNFGFPRQGPEQEDQSAEAWRRGSGREFSVMRLPQMEQNSALLWLRMKVPCGKGHNFPFSFSVSQSPVVLSGLELSW